MNAFEPIEIVLQSFWLMLPAYVPNSSAAIVGGGTPLDFGKNFFDKRRILGDGKTYRGTIGGTFVGMTLGVILMIIVYPFDQELFPMFGDSIFNKALILFCLAFGSMFGDSLGSFIKRRINIKKGAKAPLLDQYDFVIGSWLLLFIFARTWFSDNFSIYHIIVILVITPFLHRGVNILGYKMGKKEVPW